MALICKFPRCHAHASHNFFIIWIIHAATAPLFRNLLWNGRHWTLQWSFKGCGPFLQLVIVVGKQVRIVVWKYHSRILWLWHRDSTRPSTSRNGCFKADLWDTVFLFQINDWFWGIDSLDFQPYGIIARKASKIYQFDSTSMGSCYISPRVG